MPQTDDAQTEPYYDPYDFEIDADPYPVWKRLRDEQPLYRNEKYGFYALTRFDDVEKALVDWRTFSSARGTLLELINAVNDGSFEIPAGSIIFEDPPAHDVHRKILSRVFTPKRMREIEPKVRDFCAANLDPLVGSGGFDFITDIGVDVPMRTIGMFLGIPESEQRANRDHIDDGLSMKTEGMPDLSSYDVASQAQLFADYIEWRAENPSDDLMTDLLQATYVDTDGVEKNLTREEVLGYVNLLAAAGNETTTRLIGWAGKVLSEHPDQQAELAADRELVNQTIEELLRFEAPSPVQARYVMNDVELHGETVPAGSSILLINGSANRDERRFENGDSFNIHRDIDHHLSFGYGVHFCLGAHLARLEARVVLDEIVKRFPKWEVDLDNAVQARTSTVRGWEKLPVLLP